MSAGLLIFKVSKELGGGVAQFLMVKMGIPAQQGAGRAVGAVQWAPFPKFWSPNYCGRVAEWPVTDPILSVLVLNKGNTTAKSYA